MKNIPWIDNVRALCMIIIYWRHVEVYCHAPALYPQLTEPFYVNAFFIVSGYLHFRKSFDGTGRASVAKQLNDVLFRLVLPMLFFCTVLFLPKYILFRHDNFSVTTMAYEILGGVASWFVAALVVAKVLLILLDRSLHKNIWMYFAAGCVLGAGGVILGHYDPTPFPWFYKSGMIAVWLMAVGGLYFSYERYLSGMVKTIVSCCAVALAVLAAYSGRSADFSLMLASCTIVGTVECLAMCLLVIVLCQFIPENPIGSFVGGNSILYYFFCNASPAFVGVLFLRFGMTAGTGRLVFATCAVSLLLSTVIVYVIKRCLPFLLDLRKLKRSPCSE